MTNISRSKGNQATVFGQLIENKMRNNFLEQSCGEETFPRPFLKIKIEHISGSILLKFYTICFYCMSS